MRGQIRTSCFRWRRSAILRDRGEIGALGPRAYTFMGGIYSVRKVRDILAPALAERLVSDCVDVAIMVPV